MTPRQLLPLAMLLLPLIASAQVDVRFDDGGLTALAAGDDNRLASGRPSVWRVMTGEGKPYPHAAPVVEFVKERSTHTTGYGWGALIVRYEPLPHGVRIHGRILNTSSQTLSEMGINLLALRPLGEGARASKPTYGIEGPPLVVARGPLGAAAVTFKPTEPPMQVQLHKENDQWLVRLALGGDKLVVDNVPAAMALAPGGEIAFSVDVQVGSAGSDPYQLAEDAVAAYRAAHPMRLNWLDRRPILRLYFGGGTTAEEALKNLQNPDAVVPPTPDPKFREQILKKFSAAVESARAIDAQGYILWDLEGDTFPHATTYIGDPRLIRLLDPQMDLVIDEGMKLLKDAGLHVGLTLRPSRVIFDEQKKTASHSYTVAAEPFRELDAKVQYARERWGATMFYIDTNFFWRPYGEQKVWKAGQIAPDVWQRLQAKYPDTLFIPEFGNPVDFTYTAPYGEADMGDWGTPELVRAIWPESFKIIVIEDADPYHQYDQFVETVRQRNPLMTFPGGPDAPYTAAAGRIYEEAALLDAGPPQRVAEADGDALVRLLDDPDRVTRYFAARRLRQAPHPEGIEPLLARLSDAEEDWVVRHAAARALAAAAPEQADALMLDLLLDRHAGFYGAAHEFLVRQGDPARAAILARIEAIVSAGRADGRVIDALGKTLVALHAPDAAPAIRALYARVPQDAHAPMVRRRLINILGLLRDRESESLLLQALDDPQLTATAAAALVRIGSQDGIIRVRQMRDDAKAKGDNNLHSALNNALRAE
jgi:hypothetical protein